ncbi:sensor domain-containing diguanylate cyclase [Halobacillus fulvus]|nr:sensor domain-containing diguanylate cyclase [Halobacillus fulvus]
MGEMRELLIYIILYILPAATLFYMAIDVFRQNKRSTAHILLSAYVFCYGLLFFSEFLRHMTDLSYSPILVTYLFGNAGLLILAFSLHFVFKVTRIGDKLPRFLYPWVFYLPVVPILLTFLFQNNYTNSSEFTKVGLFIYPEFNASYLTTITAGNIIHLGIILLLVYVHKKIQAPLQKRTMKTLIVIASLVLVWDAIFGYVQIRGVLPAYPYIFGGMIWAVSLSLAMKKFDFLASYDRRYSMLYNLNPSTILLLDEYCRIESTNPATAKLFRKNKMVGKKLEDYIAAPHRRETMDFLQSVFESGGKFTSLETVIKAANGKERHVLMDGDFLIVDQNVYLMLIIRDIQVRKEAEQRAQFMAYHDALTKLPNRIAFYEKANETMEKKVPFALLIFDLDGFKGINDTYGHQVGDEFLIHVSRVLESILSPHGMIARVGGDEFYGYIRKGGLDVHEFLSDLGDEVDSRPFEHLGSDIPIRYSLGISYFPEDHTHLEALITQADHAMYEHKKRGRKSQKQLP